MISLSPMTQVAFERFLERVIPEYAEEKVSAGNWPAEGALERSRAEFQELLPDGPNTHKNHLYSILRDSEEVGMLWLGPIDDPSVGFIFELYVEPSARGQGVASAAMRALELEAKRLGFAHLGLHVFGHNRAARALYEKLGFETTNVNMRKSLGA